MIPTDFICEDLRQARDWVREVAKFVGPDVGIDLIRSAEGDVVSSRYVDSKGQERVVYWNGGKLKCEHPQCAAMRITRIVNKYRQ